MKILIFFLVFTTQAQAFLSWFSSKKTSSKSAKLIYPNLSPSDYGHHWKSEWTNRVYEQLDNPELVSFMHNPSILSIKAQEQVGCPNFLELNPSEKKAFWAIFIASMANREGRHQQRAYINPTDHKRKNVGVSVGLLQIDSLNASEVGCKKDDGTRLDFKATGGKVAKPADEVSMKEPLLNIKCGMYILQEELLNRAGSLMSSRSYWSILRPSGQDDEAFLRLIRRDMAQLTSCQKVAPIQKPTKKTESKKINESRSSKSPESDVAPSKNKYRGQPR
jgi:hypothetical protein